MTEKKIYRVPAIFPRGFLIEIVDYEQNPIKGVNSAMWLMAHLPKMAL